MLRTKNSREKTVAKLYFEELKSLDLKKCKTVGDIVDAMRYCAFGARMLGEVARTIFEMIEAKKPPVIIYDGLPDAPLGALLEDFVERGWGQKLVRPAD